MDETPFVDLPREILFPIAPILVKPNRKTHVVCLFESFARVNRLIVPDGAIPFFMIENIVIDRTSQLADDDQQIPAACFSAAAVGLQLGMDAMSEGSTFDLVVRNTNEEPQKFYAALFATTMDNVLHRDAPTNEKYHAFIERRQALYESIFEKVNPEERSDEDVFFNGEKIEAGSFSPDSNLWWVDVDGYKKRPVYKIEDVTIGMIKGGFQVVDVETYRGFE